MAMDGSVSVTVRGAVAELLLDRPAKHNAVTPAMAAAIADAARAVDADDAVRIVLLRGAGERAFCAGSDLNSLAAYPSTWHFRNRVEYAAAIRGIRKPVIAALQGWTLGGGAEMALGADIRIAAEGTRFGFPEVTRGWVGGGGASQLLPRMIGVARATRMLMTGDPIQANEAQSLGLFDQVVPQADLLPTAHALAAKIAGFSPVAVQSVKASVRMAMEAPLTAGLLYENEMNVLCFSAGDHLEGIRAFAEKRDAAFGR
jgi:enoyl-CoA hydratase/carnithine racemase